MESTFFNKFMQNKMKRIHMIGIGGIGMSGIAELLLNLGFHITGSDIARSAIIDRLSELGAKIFIGHHPSNVKDADLVVISSAIKADNEEIIAAKTNRIPIIQRAEMLAELMRLKYSIAVAGAHGKTTTTSMIATIFADANKDPTMVIGGKLIALGTNAKLGKGDIMIVEADESDKSFLKLSPTFTVITNIDKEHLDTYASLDDISKTFFEFMNKVPFFGAIVACIDDNIIKEILPNLEKKIIKYGLDPSADFVATDIKLNEFGSIYNLIYKGKEIASVSLKVPGIHNVKNSLAAIAISHYLDISFEEAINSLSNFAGVERRFQLIDKTKSILLIDDYAHHPTEIKAVISTAKRAWNKKIITIFQPHRFTRTFHLYKEFAEALLDSDVIILTEVYSASEKPIEGVSSKLIAEELKNKNHPHCYYIPNMENIPQFLKEILSYESIIFTLGAGNIYKLHNEISKIIKEYEKD